jgi:capsular exopolysaccharide synthesis family protein
MTGPAGLIERAAARLREDTHQAPDLRDTGVVKAAASPSSKSHVPSPPLAHQLVLDRAHLLQAGIVMPWTSTARSVEEFRIVKRNIMAAWQASELSQTNRQPRVIMVTSARPREGKTFSSINLALAFAADESLVTVLVDADSMRCDTIKTLGASREPGLTGVLSGEVRLADALIQTDLPNLVILPPGAPGPQVPELLSSTAPKELVAEIADRYPNHVILLDTPPCLASTDPTALASIASQIVFVVEASHTQQPEIEAALNLIGGGGSQICFLLNMAPASSSEHFGSYSYYYQPDKQ